MQTMSNVYVHSVILVVWHVRGHMLKIVPLARRLLHWDTGCWACAGLPVREAIMRIILTASAIYVRLSWNAGLVPTPVLWDRPSAQLALMAVSSNSQVTVVSQIAMLLNMVIKATTPVWVVIAVVWVAVVLVHLNVQHVMVLYWSKIWLVHIV